MCYHEEEPQQIPDPVFFSPYYYSDSQGIYYAIHGQHSFTFQFLSTLGVDSRQTHVWMDVNWNSLLSLAMISMRYLWTPIKMINEFKTAAIQMENPAAGLVEQK